MKKLFLTAAIVVSLITFLLPTVVIRDANADGIYHNLTNANPFAQNWANPNLIITSDDWSGVPSIIGYSDNPTDNPGGDPQLQLIPSTSVDVNANQFNPVGFTTGGVTEFDRSPITNFTIAIQGSGQHDFPNIEILLNTTSCTAPSNEISVSYNVRDLDSSADNAIQQVALHYRVGGSGNFINIPSGYIADATDPSLATRVTPVLTALPVAAQGQSQIHLRVMTSNAVGNDEWVGIDDINISCVAVTPPDTTPPSISYTALSNTNSPANRGVSATITDVVGVTNGSLSPRIYFRKDSGSYVSTQCSLTSGDAQSGVYGCTIDYSLVGGISAGSTIHYYVVAQDAAGNVASNPAGVAASDVNAVTTPPPPNSYVINGPTAAEVSIAGRVTTVDGRAIRGVRIEVNGGNLAGPRFATTTAFGYFLITGLRAGESYVVSVSGKRYVFETPSRVVTLGDSAFDVDFVGSLR